MSITNVEYSQKELTSIVFYNLVHLFERRGYISDYNKVFEQNKDKIDVNKIIKIETNNKETIQIYISGSKINSISQGSSIDEFLRNNIDEKKFLILVEPNKKIFKQSKESYPNSEAFSHNELLEDIPEKDIIPKHQLLSEKEKEELLENFNAKSFKRIYEFDIMSRYYGAKPNDIFRIERMNTTSGKGIDYRLVIPGKYDLIF
tara:strand:+ start:223 stop:831 length:609 start_codon:yes stop_codon:yes gene_type:complete